MTPLLESGLDYVWNWIPRVGEYSEARIGSCTLDCWRTGEGGKVEVNHKVCALYASEDDSRV